MKSLRKSLLFTLAVFALGCDLPKEFVDFIQLSKSDRESVFRGMPLDKQIDFHLLAMSMEPPNYSLAPLIAEKGYLVLSPVLDRIKHEENDRKKVDLLVLLEYLCRKRECESERPDLYSELSAEVNRIQDPFWKELGERSVRYIRGDNVSLTVPR